MYKKTAAHAISKVFTFVDFSKTHLLTIQNEYEFSERANV